MIIAMLNEGPEEFRVAITPSMVKSFSNLGFEVICEENAGWGAGFLDEQYRQAGAKIFSLNQKSLIETNVLVSVGPPAIKAIKQLPEQALIVTQIEPEPDHEIIQWCLKHNISLFAMNLIPCLSRTQSINCLNSQANIAGYRAVIEAAFYFSKTFPLLMTAAGKIGPAKVLVIGAGVAGLQAMITAKRLGATVFAYDSRVGVQEQVEGLGVEWVVVHETLFESKTFQEVLTMADIIICPGLIFDPNPLIKLDKAIVNQLKPGAVIVDFPTQNGNHCTLSKPNQVVQYKSITIIHSDHFANKIPAAASELYSRNIINLLRVLTVSLSLVFNPQDEIIQQALICHNGIYFPFANPKK